MLGLSGCHRLQFRQVAPVSHSNPYTDAVVTLVRQTERARVDASTSQLIETRGDSDAGAALRAKPHSSATLPECRCPAKRAARPAGRPTLERPDAWEVSGGEAGVRSPPGLTLS